MTGALSGDKARCRNFGRTSGIKIEKIPNLVSSATNCSTPAPPVQISNYGTFSYQQLNLLAGQKLNNYATSSVGGTLDMAAGTELYNYSHLTVGTLKIPASTTVYQKPGSMLDANKILQDGFIQSDLVNYSTVNAATLTIGATGTITGLMKLCVQNLTNDGSIASSVVQDCVFEVPGLPSRIAYHISEEVGLKTYEFSNHLGNVLTTVSDRRIGVTGSNSLMYDHYTAVVMSSSDYYAFGSSMPGRTYSSGSYRYGFNGKEDDKETGWQDYGERMYNPIIARFFTVDPITRKYAMLSPYQFASNSPIDGIDLDGLEHYNAIVYNFVGSHSSFPVLKKVEWYNVKQHNAYGPMGPGITITTINVDPCGKEISRNQVFYLRNKIFQDWGVYCGGTQIDHVFYRTYKLPPVDMVDQAAKLHDQGYDKVKATADNTDASWATIPADLSLIAACDNVLNLFNSNPQNPIDLVSQQPMTLAEIGQASNVSDWFNGKVGTKINDVSDWMEENYPEEAHSASGGFWNDNEGLQKKNYQLFKNKYMEYDNDSKYWGMKKGMWKEVGEGKDKHWVPKTKKELNAK